MIPDIQMHEFTGLYFFKKFDWYLFYCSEQMMFFVYEKVQAKSNFSTDEKPGVIRGS